MTVALIDDGVNFMHEAVAARLDTGRNFPIGNASDPFHGSTTGHGSIMAYMIGRVCHTVKIYVCKLDVVRQPGEKASFTAESAADLWNLQQIAGSISSPYPGRYRDRTIRKAIIIGAAKADGEAYDWMGSPADVDFILPGHKATLRVDDIIEEKGDTPKPGSSVATALAVGLGALIIHCVRLGAIYNHYHHSPDETNAINKGSVQTIKRFSNMKQAFDTVSFRYTGNDRVGKNLEVESFFKDVSSVISVNSDRKNSEKWKRIARLARDLVPSSMNRTYA
ncbi:hypothetical protein GGI43DRAFT_383927 [Trichoderma evansii]